MRRTAGIAILAAALALPLASPAAGAACYGPKPAVTVDEPTQLVNMRPFTVSGTAISRECAGQISPVSSIMLEFWPSLSSVPIRLVATCPACPASSVSWSLTITDQIGPHYYTLDVHGRDVAGNGDRVRLNTLVL